MEDNVEEVENKVPKSDVVSEEALKSCNCSELEARSEKEEAKIVELELEMEKRKSDYEALEVKFKGLEAEKISVEAELEASRIRNNVAMERGKAVEGGHKDTVVDLTEDGDEDEDDDDIVDLIMDENAALQCEKTRAESEVEVWKKKFEQLELWVSQVDDITLSRGGKQLLNEVIKGNNTLPVEQLQSSKEPLDSVPSLCTPGKTYKDDQCGYTPLSGTKGVCLKSEQESHRMAKRHLSFEKEERSPNKKMAPSTPASAKPTRLNVIDIFGSDDDSDGHSAPLSIPNDQEIKKICNSTDHVLTGTADGEQDLISNKSAGRAVGCEDHDEDLDDYKDNIPNSLTFKRKRAAKIITSDSESDEDDNIPISKLKKVYLQESVPNIAESDMYCCSKSAYDNVKCNVTRSRRRLVTLRQCEETVKAESSSQNIEHGQEFAATDDAEDVESEEVGSESEGESLGGFIVDSSDISDADNMCIALDDTSDSDVDFGGILSKLQRSKDSFKWELEADMLSAFGKNLELCMKAVCALYRQQTSDEQVSKETIYANKRGFSQIDALRGTELALYLTEGDPHGDLKKSAKQLEERGSYEVELCKTLATRYSKQLFEIYKKKEDPLFLPVLN
ncbi:uncharacterized protein LOC126675120 [Mercurialis annua]|uniref:uncharacterized protein LOC126675120 n=1 Tax=Mercurialis annua TaxID=3986 RepID=UPI00215FCBC5|nr:uncharacterized protein LOC126675120 [Mercurialis annua]XP_050225668.1 uncharacterized protein LOC126675120 [Mercurialis annua]